MYRIYAIYDTAAESIVGGLQLHKHDAAAIRAYTEIASNPETLLAKHPNDFELRYLGILHEEDCEICPEHTVILTGKQWAAVHRPDTITAEVNRNSDLGAHFASAQKDNDKNNIHKEVHHELTRARQVHVPDLPR